MTSFRKMPDRGATPGDKAARAVIPHDAHKRLARESQTIAAMIACYCRDHHGAQGAPCSGCMELRDYAAERLERCRFGPDKPVCAKCPVHCYQRLRREQIRAVMRYAGPRMLWRHPILSLHHWLQGRRAARIRV